MTLKESGSTDREVEARVEDEQKTFLLSYVVLSICTRYFDIKM